MSLTSIISHRFNARRSLPRSIRAMRAVAIAGIAIAVASLVVATAIGRGFEQRYRRALLDFNAHVVVLGVGEIEAPEEAEQAIDAARYRSASETQMARRWAWLVPWQQRVARAVQRVLAISEMARTTGTDQTMIAHALQILDPRACVRLIPPSLRRFSGVLADIGARGVVGRTPFLYREALAVGGGKIAGVVVKGIDPMTVRNVNAMPVRLFGTEASIDDALAVHAGKPPAVIAGQALAASLGVEDSAKTIQVLIPRERGERASAHPFEAVRIVGTFASGMHDYDAQFMLMSLSQARKLFLTAPTAITGIEIALDDPDRAAAVADALEQTLGPRYSAVSWGELNRDLLSAVRLEQLVSFVIMGMMIVVAALNIVAVLVLTTLYRLHETAVLKALGVDDSVLGAVLTRGGSVLGCIGAVCGLGMGVGIAWAIDQWHLIPLEPEIYLIEALPVDISPVICGIIAALCIGIGWGTSRCASRRLIRIPIAEGLRRAR